MKFTLALFTSLLGLTLAAPASLPASESRHDHDLISPAFTHNWTNTPDPGVYTPTDIGYIFFSAGAVAVSTHQTFISDFLPNRRVRISFEKGSANIPDGTRFSVYQTLSDLDLEEGQIKQNTNNQRDRPVATFQVIQGRVTLVDSQGVFIFPNRRKVTFEIVGESTGSQNANSRFNTVDAGLRLTLV